MADWPDLFDPATWEKVTSAVKATASILDALGKIRDRLSRPRTPKRDLEQEVDELRAILHNITDLMIKDAENQKGYAEGILDSIRTLAKGGVQNLAGATAKLGDVLEIHERRLRALEEARPSSSA